jgi:tetratricopeptide (TPR) repeat protein
VRGRPFALGLASLLALALLGQTVRAARRVESTIIVGAVRRAMSAVQQTGRAPRQLTAGAELALAEASRLDPVAIEPRAFRGDLLLMLGRAAAAAPAYERATAHEPRPEVLFHHGLALWQLGRRDEAVAQLRRSLALMPQLQANVPPEALGLVLAAPVTPLPAP